MQKTRGGSNYTKLYKLHFISNFNYTHNFSNQLQLHYFNFNYIMQNQIYSAFGNYIILKVLLNFNILHTNITVMSVHFVEL